MCCMCVYIPCAEVGRGYMYMHICVHVNLMAWTNCVYSLLMRANKLEIGASGYLEISGLSDSQFTFV